MPRDSLPESSSFELAFSTSVSVEPADSFVSLGIGLGVATDRRFPCRCPTRWTRMGLGFRVCRRAALVLAPGERRAGGGDDARAQGLAAGVGQRRGDVSGVLVAEGRAEAIGAAAGRRRRLRYRRLSLSVSVPEVQPLPGRSRRSRRSRSSEKYVPERVRIDSLPVSPELSDSLSLSVALVESLSSSPSSSLSSSSSVSLVVADPESLSPQVKLSDAGRQEPARAQDVGPSRVEGVAARVRAAGAAGVGFADAGDTRDRVAALVREARRIGAVLAKDERVGAAGDAARGC